MKKILSLFLSVAVLVSVVAGVDLSTYAATNNDSELVYGTVTTRAQWLHNLSVIFEMSVNEDTIPDNYFSDLAEDHEYYNDILLAVSFGVVDIDAGNEIEPDSLTTREFAAHTLNFCLGYQFEGSSYSFSDFADCNYPNDAQIAVNRGWFSLSGGNFNPAENVTENEVKIMLSDAQESLDELVVDENYNSTWSLKDGVVEIPSYKDVEINDDASKVTIIDNEELIENGDIFVVYQNNIPVPYKAQTISVDGNKTIIEIAEVDFSDAFNDIDAQGAIESDEIEFESAQGGLEFEVEEETEQLDTANYSLQSRSTVKIKKNLTFPEQTVKIGGVNVKISGSFKNAKAEYSIKSKSSHVKITGDLLLRVSASASVSGSYSFINCTIPGIGGLTLSLNMNVTGSVTSTINNNVTFGISYSKPGGTQIIQSFNKENNQGKADASNITTEVLTTVGVEAKCGLTQFPAASGYIYAKAGLKFDMKNSIYSDGKFPKNCKTFAMWLYASYGAYASCDYLNLSYDNEISIYNSSNSPTRVYKHYEDGKEISTCSRGESLKYFTKYSSRYWGCGLYGVDDGYGLDANGNLVPIYTYTLDASNNATITGYQGYAGYLEIPEEIDGYTVVSIGSNAFKSNNSLTFVKIPDTVTSIGTTAFANCINLQEVVLSNNLSALGNYAFQNCISLTSVYIPKTITKINNPYFPFSGCSGLNNVTFASGITSIPNGLFGKSGIKHIAIPNTVTEIGASAFNGCSYLSEISLPKYLAKIGNYAFKDCISITRINLPKSLTQVDTYGYNYHYPFSGCVSLKIIDFENGITKIPLGIFGNTGIEALTVPNTVTEIAEAAFAGCTLLRKVELPYTLTKIGVKAFAGCTNLSEVQLPKYLTDLDAYAFGNCTSLTTINLPKTLKTIGYYDGMTSTSAYPFKNCTALETFTYDDGVTNIPENVFRSSGLKNIVIPKTIQTIGNSAFRNCTNLNDVKIEEGVTNIGDYAFAYSGLIKISIPDTVTGMGKYVFSDCSNLNSVKLPNTRKNITEGTFKNCISLNNIDLPDTVQYIRTSAFEGSGIKNIKLPSKVELIESSAFKNSTVESVAFSTNETSIGNYAFQNCDNLQSISLPDSVKSIGTYIFQDCDILTDVNLGIGITEIPSYAFSHCDALEQICLPHYVKKISSNAFSNSVMFKEITIPKATTSIDSTSFSYPDELTIKCVAGSYAETYAKDNAIKYVNYESPAESAVLSEHNLSLNARESATVICNVLPKNFTDDVVFESSNMNVATVDSNGLITAVSSGTATITVTVGNVSDECIVNVFEPVDYISLNKTYLSLEKGESYKLVAQVSPNTATNKTLEWSSSDNTVATVDNNGNVTAISNGDTVITVNALDGSNASETCDVHVYDNSKTELVHNANSVEELESEHDYSDNRCEYWIYTLTDANNLSVVFDSRTYVEDGYDYITIYDKNDNIVGKFTGYDLSGETVIVPGNTVKIKLESDSSNQGWGFKVTSVTANIHTHQYSQSIINATCTESGYIIYKCTCGESYFEEILPLGHTYRTTTTKATISKNGSVVTLCSLCGTLKSKSTIYYPKTISLSTTSYTYDGKVKKPTVKVVGSNGKTISSSNYTVSYASGRKNVGKYSVKVTFKGNYSGTKTLYFTIKPKTTSISSLSAGSKKFTVKWKKQSTQVTGYQIQYSTSSKFTSPKTVTVSSYKTTSKTISKLKGKKKYYVRVRTYKTVGKTKYYSSWSGAKSTTTKK